MYDSSGWYVRHIHDSVSYNVVANFLVQAVEALCVVVQLLRSSLCADSQWQARLLSLYGHRY